MRCTFCHTDTENNSLEENIKRIKNCTNCLADLTINGKWTGDGQKILVKLCDIYGAQKVKYALEKITFEEI